MGVIVLILTVSIGIIFSDLFQPIFFDRHMFPALGCFWMSFSVLICKIYPKKEIFIPILLILLFVSANSTMNFINAENSNEKALTEITNVLDNITNTDLIVTADDNFITTFFTVSVNRYIIKDKDISINAYLKNSNNWELEKLRNVTIYKTLGYVPETRVKLYLYGYENFNDLIWRIDETINRNGRVYFFSKEDYDVKSFKEIVPDYKLKNIYNFTKSPTDTSLIEKVYLVTR